MDNPPGLEFVKRKNRQSLRTLLLALLCTIPCSSAHGGSITGRVVDAKTGDALVGATVYLPLLGRGRIADRGGGFAFTDLRSGFYTLEVSMIGYVKWRRENVRVSGLDSTILRIPLSSTVLPLGEEIVVYGQRALLDINEPSTRRVVRSDVFDLSGVPTVIDAVRRQPGVTQVDRELHLRGGRSYETEYRVDGISVTDPFLRQGMAVRPAAGAIDRLAVQVGGINPGDGAAASGVVSVDTPQPGDQLSGSLRYSTDHISPSANGRWNSDEAELSLSGPFSVLGVRVFGDDARFVPAFVLNLNARLTDTHLGAGHPNASAYGGTRWAPRGDNQYRALAKLVWRLNPRHRLTALFSSEYVIDQDKGVLETRLRTATYSYGWPFEYARHLEGYNTFGREANLQSVRWEYRPSGTSAVEWNIARVFSRLHSDVNGKTPADYEPPQDTGPVIITPSEDSTYFTVDAGDGFYDIGDGDLWYDHYVETHTLTSKVELSPQPNWELHSGIEIADQDLQVIDIFRPWFGVGGLNTDAYRVSSQNAVWWGKSRFNLDGAVIDIGLRTELWFPGVYLEDAVADTTLPNITQGMRDGFTDGTFELFGHRARGWILPRLGASFVLSPSASVFATYDRLARRPNPRFLYAKLHTRSPATFQLFGNPALEPERTTALEGGIKWTKGENLAVTLSVYQRDIRDYVAASVVVPDPEHPENYWYIYANQDMAQSRGIEWTATGRFSSFFKSDAMVSVARVKGESSLPSDVFRGLTSREEGQVLLQEARLDWDKPWRFSWSVDFTSQPGDQRHLLGIRLPEFWDANVSFWAEAGKRYTPYTDSVAFGNDTVYYRAGDPNSALGPYWSSLDITIRKHYAMGRSKLTLSIGVANLLNHRNVTLVNPVTGREYRRGEPIPTGDNFFETAPEGYDLPIWDNSAGYDQPIHWTFGVQWSW